MNNDFPPKRKKRWSLTTKMLDKLVSQIVKKEKCSLRLVYQYASRLRRAEVEEMLGVAKDRGLNFMFTNDQYRLFNRIASRENITKKHLLLQMTKEYVKNHKIVTPIDISCLEEV